MLNLSSKNNIKCEALSEIVLIFHDKVDSFNNTGAGAQILDSICHMPLNHLNNKQTKRFGMQKLELRHIYIRDVVTFTN